MDILMPQLGETVAEGKITVWFKAIGDAVAPGDNLFEIETDKVSMEVPATSTGVLQEIRVAAGEVAPVGAVVAVIRLREAWQAPRPTAAPRRWPALSGERPLLPIVPYERRPRCWRQTTAAASALPGRPIVMDPFREVRTPERNFGPARLASGAVVTPLARRLAGEAGIDLLRVAPSGPHGRIVARDVASAIAADAGPLARGPAAPSPERIKALYEPGSYEEIPLDSMRRTIAARLIEAKQTIPHFYPTADVTIGRLNAQREEANAAALPDDAGKPAFRLSVNDFIIKALALALERVPAANAVWAEWIASCASAAPMLASRWRSRAA